MHSQLGIMFHKLLFQAYEQYTICGILTLLKSITQTTVMVTNMGDMNARVETLSLITIVDIDNHRWDQNLKNPKM